MPDFKIIIEGTEAKAAAAELAGAVNEALGFAPEPAAPEAEMSARIKKMGPETVSLILSAATLVLSIPAAVLAVRELLDRPEKKKQADRLVRAVNAVAEKYPSVNIFMISPGGKPVVISDADGNTLIEMAGKKKS